MFVAQVDDLQEIDASSLGQGTMALEITRAALCPAVDKLYYLVIMVKSSY